MHLLVTCIHDVTRDQESRGQHLDISQQVLVRYTAGVKTDPPPELICGVQDLKEMPMGRKKLL
jgi:hypothetical protein